MVKKSLIFIVLIFILSSCYIVTPTATIPAFTPTPSNTPFPALTNTPFVTPTYFPTQTPFPTLVPSIGEYQGIGARQIECGVILLPPGVANAECYNIGGIGGARIYFNNSNNLVLIAITYKFGQGYDAGIFATQTALQYDWSVSDIIGLISMMKNSDVLYTDGSLSGTCEVSEDNTMVYMLISPDISLLSFDINVN